MAQNQEGETGGLRHSVAPWRSRASSGMRLSLSPPPLSLLNRVDADWKDENEDDVTDVADRSTLIFKRVRVPDDETTVELPGHAVRRGPALRNEAWTLPPRLGVRPWRVAAALAAVAVLAVIAFERRPGQGKIVVNARDSRGGPVNHLEVFVDGERTPCTTAPCYVPSGKGLHEVKVIADGFEVPAAQAVAVASRHSTAAYFVVGSPGGSGIKVSGSQDGVTLAVDGKETGPLPQVLRDLAPGDHTIRLAGSERYEPILRHVTVERDKVEDLGTINLKVVKGHVAVGGSAPRGRVSSS